MGSFQYLGRNRGTVCGFQNLHLNRSAVDSFQYQSHSAGSFQCQYHAATLRLPSQKRYSMGIYQCFAHHISTRMVTPRPHLLPILYSRHLYQKLKSETQWRTVLLICNEMSKISQICVPPRTVVLTCCRGQSQWIATKSWNLILRR